MVTKTALVAWGSGALAASAAGVIAVTQLASAAPTPAPTASASSTAASGGTTAAGTQSSGNVGNGNGNGNGNNGNGNGNGGSSGGSTPASKALVATAVLTGAIAPGVPGTLTVKVDNPNNQAVVLKSVTGTVTNVTTGNRPGLQLCNKSWITIAPFTGSKTIAKNGSTTVPLAVTFVNKPDVNQDNCKGVTYTYSFSAAADQA